MDIRAGVPSIAEIARADNSDAQCIALVLTEEAAEQSSWRIRLSVELGDGSRGELGQLITRTLADSLGRPSRVIGVATCPGARAWFAEVTLLASAAPWASGVLTAAPAPGGATRAEVAPNRPNANAAIYSVQAGVAAGPVAETVGAGARVLAITAEVDAGAPAAGTIAIAGSDVISILPGTAITFEPAGALMGPLQITFTDCLYAWEQEL